MRINGEPVDTRPHPASACAPSCATPGAWTSRRAATPATAAPAPCTSTARRCTPASTRPPGPSTTTSPPLAGLGTPEDPHPVQRAFADAAGFQCGFCTAGFVMTAAGAPDGRRDVERCFKGNLCRCTGYRSIRDALAGTRNVGPGDGAASAPRSAPRRRNGSSPAPSPTPSTCPTTGVLHMALVQSPHAHARITRIDTTRAEAAPGVRLVLTHRDVPDVLYSTARHESRLDDPDDTRMLDDVVRFRGQRVAAVVAESVARGAARGRPDRDRVRRAAGRLRPRGRPRGRCPAAARRQGDRRVAGSPSRSATSSPRPTARSATSRPGWPPRPRRCSGTWHDGARHARRDGDPRRARLARRGRPAGDPDQHPGAVPGARRAGPRPRARRRTGCGWSPPASAAASAASRRCSSRTWWRSPCCGPRQPVQLELTREQQFTLAPCRHPMRVSVTARRRRRRRAHRARASTCSATPAPTATTRVGVLFHGCHESVALYRCANKRVDAEAVYTNNLPSGAFRGYGLGQVIFGIESALDDLARELGISPVELRRRNVVRPGDEFVVNGAPDTDLVFGSYGLDQCLDLVEAALAARRRRPRRPATGWAVGEGMAASMIATIPPRGHHSEATVGIDVDGTVTIGVGSAEFGNGSATVHVQLVAEELGIDPARIRLHSSDTDAAAYDTGAFGSTGSVVAGHGRRRRGPRAARGARCRRNPAVEPIWATLGYAEVGRVQRPRRPGRRRPADRRAAGAALGARRRRRPGDQPRAAARPGRGRRRPGARQRAAGGADGPRRRGAHPRVPALPGAADRRRAADRGALRRHVRRARPARRQVDERGAVQPGRTGDRQRRARRPRRTPLRAADEPGPALATLHQIATTTTEAP